MSQCNITESQIKEWFNKYHEGYLKYAEDGCGIGIGYIGFDMIYDLLDDFGLPVASRIGEECLRFIIKKLELLAEKYDDELFGE